MQPFEFMECDNCRVKLGSPYLCASCYHNQEVISILKGSLDSFKETMYKNMKAAIERSFGIEDTEDN